MEPFDGPAKTAADFAIEDINGDGGVSGRQLQTTTANTKSKPELSGDAATQVLNDGADIVVTSCDFDQGSPAAIVAQKDGVLAFSTCAASTAFGPAGIGPLAFTMATAAPAEGASMAEWAYEKKGYRSATVLLDDTIEFDKQSAYGFQKRWEDLGGEARPADVQAGRRLDRVADQRDQVGEPRTSSTSPPTCRARPRRSSSCALRGSTSRSSADEDIDGDYWKGGVPDLNDVYYATYASIYGDDPDPKVNELVDRYKQKTGKLPDTSAFLTGYAMIQAIQKAVEGADGSTEGSALQDQLQQFDNEQLLLPTTFDDQYHITLKRSLALMQIADGKTSYLEEWTPKDVPIPPGA